MFRLRAGGELAVACQELAPSLDELGTPLSSNKVEPHMAITKKTIKLRKSPTAFCNCKSGPGCAEGNGNN